MTRSEHTISFEGKYLVSLLRAAIRGEDAPPAPPELDWRRLFSLARMHMVEATVFRTVEATESCPEEILSRWKGFADNALRVELLYDHERALILRQFDEAGIDYLPLKGILVKDLYPRKGMRQFSDNDILFDKKKRKWVKKIMQELGYQAEKQSSYSAHDVYLKPPVFNFEMHRALFNRSQEMAYFKEIWKRAVKEEGNCCAYRMTNEDFYLYSLAHLEKHYTHGGAGLRFFADLWLLLGQRRDLDHIGRVVKELGLKEFECEMRAISEAWFGDEPQDIPEETFRFVLTSGAHGTLQHEMETQVKQGTGLFRYIFLPFREMKARFPILKYLPFLLPFCWLIRLLRAPFDKKKRRKALLVAKYNREKKEHEQR